MPEDDNVENPVEEPTPKTKKRNEKTEAKFLEDADKLIAEAERLGAEYVPPSVFAQVVPLKAKRDAVRAQRTVSQSDAAKLEDERNKREILYKAVRSDVGSLVEYAKSASVPANQVDALRSIYREMRGVRAGTAGENSISVSHQSYASLADTYARFIEQYDVLDLKSTEDIYKASTYRAKLAAIQQANLDVIGAQSKADTSSQIFDQLAYVDADSLLNGCILGKSYIKSKYKTKGEPYKNISKTRFVMPSRFR